MNLAELTKDVQFTVDQQGQTTAVVIPVALWHTLIELLEDTEDRELVRTMQDRLRQHPEASSALRWRDVEKQWSDASATPPSQP